MRGDEIEQLLHHLIFDEVSNALKRGKLSSIERRIAIELARMGEPSDARLLSCARGLVAQGLRQLADLWEQGGLPDDRDLDIRYENAICREILAAMDEAAASTANTSSLVPFELNSETASRVAPTSPRGEG